jgi:hypothetical protein
MPKKKEFVGNSLRMPAIAMDNDNEEEGAKF